MDYKIDSGAYRRFIFNVNENQEGFKIFFDSTVKGNGLDLRFVLCTHGDGKKLIKWMNNRRKRQYDSKGQMMTDQQGYPVTVAVPPPQIEKFFDVRTNILNRTVIATLEKICNGFWIPENIRFTVNVDARVLQKV